MNGNTIWLFREKHYNSRMNKRNLLIMGIIIVLLAVVSGAYYVSYLRKAHSTFQNYYDFRGCTELVSRAETSGICKTRSRQTIKIVKYNNRWYLDGDLPVCDWGICF